jgi:hypothetical protein
MATPPTWTPGDGEALALGVGVGNEFGIGVGPGVGLWAKAVEQTIDAPRNTPQMTENFDFTSGILSIAFLCKWRVRTTSRRE